jgi:hypothetical protein
VTTRILDLDRRAESGAARRRPSAMKTSSERRGIEALFQATKHNVSKTETKLPCGVLMRFTGVSGLVSPRDTCRAGLEVHDLGGMDRWWSR